MSQLQDLTRCLLAAGGGPHPEGKGFVLLYTDQSSLISKVWTGSSFGDQELIDTDVRANSPAPYLLMPTTCIILSISDSSKLVSFRYDVEEEEWVPNDIPDHVVHADGKLAAATDVDGRVSVFYQSVEERLVHHDEAWKPTLLPAQPVIGTPLTTLLSDDRVHVFYISAGDRCLHYIVRDSSGVWTDELMSSTKFDENPKRFVVAKDDSKGRPVAYVLTERNEVLQVGAGEEALQLGVVDKSGTFVPGTSAECCLNLWFIKIDFNFTFKFTVAVQRAGRANCF